MTAKNRTSSLRSKRSVRTEIPAIPDDVQLTTLDNGLTVIIREDHSAPVVSSQAWCQTGSIHEGRWLGAGLSHVLEHMLFKGTARRAGHDIDREVQDAGGYLNAYTSFDRTVYWINVPNTGAAVAIDVLCDIMQHASLPPDELAKELDVIRREMDMNEDDPSRKSSRRLFETAYMRSPYRHTIIGYPDIFNTLKPEDIRGYYEERYAPNNCFLVIVGDVDAGQALEQVRQAYSDAPARPLAPVLIAEEPAQTATREVIEESTIELGHLHFSWHIPCLRHADVPALDVLATLLGTGRSSRLYRRVRQELGLVHSIDAWTYSPGNPGLIGMSALIDAHQYEPAREAMLREVEEMKRRAVPAAELAKAVKQFMTATLATRKTMQGQANDLGSNWLAANDLNFSERYLEAVRALTPADLRRVARQYLTTENRTLYALLPKGGREKTRPVAAASTDHAIEKITLENGLRLLIKQDHRLPFVEIRSALRAGVLAESPQNNGITQLMSRMLLKGTRKQSADAIAEQIESLGGSLDSFAGNNSFGLTAEVLAEDLGRGMRLFAEVLREPGFPKGNLERERTIQLASIKSQRDHLLKSAFRLMQRQLFGERNYGLDALGTVESVSTLGVKEVRAWHKELTTPEQAVVAVFGAVKPERVVAEAKRYLGSWKPGQGRGPWDAVLRDAPAGTGKLTETRDKQQAVVVVGFPGTRLDSSDRFALDLIQEICSDLGSRLFLRIREKLGLAYYVGAQNFAGVTPGSFALYAGTEPAKAAQVEAELLKEAELLARKGLTAEELKRAKAKILGQRKIARQELGGLAMSCALDELYGLGFNHSTESDALYEAVTLKEAREVAQRYLRTDQAVIAVVGGTAKAGRSGPNRRKPRRP